MAPLTADAKRLRTIIISFPILVVTTAILYRRTYLGEEQRRIPGPNEVQRPGKDPKSILGDGTLGGAPWVPAGEEAQRR
ncbi:uncharacterized protein EHS24_001051 [Apiotrichum porosum]|uniref:Uncharacterized protein n=1 Tax=Apiotrichum porosum TaxID=105984 RepID=A0A427YBR6_9TREE|nr:uncharacterized protein EHS24_001051 [Apiotrichum porosum]RSH88506.1 hypothetical protein EHS24_001051 [Apiotrichum porosum]